MVTTSPCATSGYHFLATGIGLGCRTCYRKGPAGCPRSWEPGLHLYTYLSLPLALIYKVRDTFFNHRRLGWVRRRSGEARLLNTTRDFGDVPSDDTLMDRRFGVFFYFCSFSFSFSLNWSRLSLFLVVCRQERMLFPESTVLRRTFFCPLACVSHTLFFSYVSIPTEKKKKRHGLFRGGGEEGGGRVQELGEPSYSFRVATYINRIPGRSGRYGASIWR